MARSGVFGAFHIREVLKARGAHVRRVGGVSTRRHALSHCPCIDAIVLVSNMHFVAVDGQSSSRKSAESAYTSFYLAAITHVISRGVGSAQGAPYSAAEEEGW